MQNLLVEVGDLSRRNDELMTAKDSDLVVIRDLDNQLKEYKRKYEQAKTELRSVKGTSGCYSFYLSNRLSFSSSYISALSTNTQDRQTRRPIASQR